MDFVKCAYIDVVREIAEGTELEINLLEPLATGESLAIFEPLEKSFAFSNMRTIDDEPIKEAEEGATVRIMLGITSLKFREGMTLHKQIEEAIAAKGGSCDERRHRK